MNVIAALVLCPDLVCTDVLGDAAGFACNDVRVADRVEDPRLSVVDVTHDGDNGGTDLEFLVGFVVELLLEVDVEAFEKLFVFIFRRDDLNLVAEFFAEDSECRLIEGLCGRRHFTEVEENGHQISRARVDLVSEV